MGSQQLNARVPDGIAEAARAAAADAGVNLGEYIARLIDADTQSRRALFDKAFDNFVDDAAATGLFDDETPSSRSLPGGSLPVAPPTVPPTPGVKPA
jgi:hypothetical protein